MVNYFHANQIAQQIKFLLDENLPYDAAKNIYIGDLSVLPAPDKLAEFLPAAVISADEMENIPANESKSIFYTPYMFKIYYVYPYTFEGDNDAVRKGVYYAERTANVLMNYGRLDSFTIPKSEAESGGMVISAQLLRIRYESAENELFRALYIPAFIAVMDYQVDFRTMSREAKI